MFVGHFHSIFMRPLKFRGNQLWGQPVSSIISDSDNFLNIDICFLNFKNFLGFSYFIYISKINKYTSFITKN